MRPVADTGGLVNLWVGMHRPGNQFRTAHIAAKLLATFPVCYFMTTPIVVRIPRRCLGQGDRQATNDSPSALWCTVPLLATTRFVWLRIIHIVPNSDERGHRFSLWWRWGAVAKNLFSGGVYLKSRGPVERARFSLLHALPSVPNEVGRRVILCMMCVAQKVSKATDVFLRGALRNALAPHTPVALRQTVAKFDNQCLFLMLS